MNDPKTIQQRATQPALLDGNKIKGYAIVWDSLNDYGEIAVRGCCAKSLRARGINGKEGNSIQLLLQHNSAAIMGKFTRLEEDETGLYFEADLLDLDETRDDVKRIREGLLRQLSYGFYYKEGGYEYRTTDDGETAVYLTDIDLYEISLVTFSSDPRAQLRARCASMSREEAAAHLRAMDRAKESTLKKLAKILK